MDKHLKMCDILHYFKYDEGSPSGLCWCVDRWAGATKHILKASAGSVAGCLSKENRYWIVKVKKKSYKVHRIIYEILHACELDDAYFIDHIDGGRGNNKIGNLRRVLRSQNAQNAKKRVDNSTGVTGVFLHNYEKTLGYLSLWSQNGVRGSKLFSIRKYGLLESFTLACQFRAKKIEELNNLGADYTETHGVRL